MTVGDRATIYIQAINRNTQGIGAREKLGGERFIDSPKIDLLSRKTETVKQLGNGKDRANVHLFRRATGDDRPAKQSKRLQFPLSCQRSIHQDQCGFAIRELAGVARRDMPAVRQGRLQRLEDLEAALPWSFITLNRQRAIDDAAI